MAKNVMCKKCNNLINGWCEKKIDIPDPNMVRDCQYFWEKTNADRIRAMSDEELAQWLAEHQCLIAEKVSMVYGIGFICDDMDIQECAKENLTWLQQPATGGGFDAR